MGVALPESKEEFNFQAERWVQRLINRVIRYEGEIQSQESHTEQDGWIKCSERMPDVKTAVLVGCFFGRNWTSKWATFVPGSPESQISGWIIPGASWKPTHWMPLPAAPKPEAL
ncbi:DUF551 domain-containing protein [Rahnella inusitata]|nr:DUF551 domain-containing protein [Rahnella inusitata]